VYLVRNSCRSTSNWKLVRSFPHRAFSGGSEIEERKVRKAEEMTVLRLKQERKISAPTTASFP
jgi:hypothetical protein